MSDALWQHVAKEGPANYVRNSTKPWEKTGSMKIHDWEIFACYVGKYVLMTLWDDEEVYSIVCRLLDAIAELMARKVETSDLQAQSIRLLEAIANFERKFPRFDHSILLHICIGKA